MWMKRCFERQQALYNLEYSGIVVTNGGALFHALGMGRNA